MTACTPLRALLERVRAAVPEPHHTGRAYYRAWSGTMPAGIPVEDGPDDALSVTWCDGELCLCLPELIRYLRGGEERAGDRSATECHREFVEALVAFAAMGDDGVFACLQDD